MVPFFYDHGTVYMLIMIHEVYCVVIIYISLPNLIAISTGERAKSYLPPHHQHLTQYMASGCGSVILDKQIIGAKLWENKNRNSMENELGRKAYARDQLGGN